MTINISDIIDIKNYHYSYRDGVLRVSWHDPNGVTIKQGNPIFKIHASGSFSDGADEISIALTNTIKPEVYISGGVVKRLGITHKFDENRPFEVMGNTPNPWNQQTGIHFYLPENGVVAIKVRDITGRIVYVSKENMSKGEHIISLTQEQLNASGLLIYDINFGNEVRTMKMLNIR